LNFSAEEVLRMFHERRAVMTDGPDGELVTEEKQ
jgi:hypothetical protein